MVFEELGDILEFPENLRERDGLRIAGALRDGYDDDIRDGLSKLKPLSADQEWDMIAGLLEGLEPNEARSARGGRPKARPVTPGWDGGTLTLSNGITLRKEADAKGYNIQISGKSLPPDILEELIERISYLLDSS